MSWLSQLFGMFRVFQCWVVIAPWERAVRVRLGKTAKLLGPGFHIRIPLVDRFFVQSIRLRPVFDTGQTVTTSDGKILTVAFTIWYAIGDLLKLYNATNQPESMLIGLVQSQLADTISSTSSDSLSVLTLGKSIVDKLPANDWGLVDVQCKITTFAYVRTYRLLSNEYRSLTNTDDLEQTKI